MPRKSKLNAHIFQQHVCDAIKDLEHCQEQLTDLLIVGIMGDKIYISRSTPLMERQKEVIFQHLSEILECELEYIQ